MSKKERRLGMLLRLLGRFYDLLLPGRRQELKLVIAEAQPTP
jgi:hypothetical protein